MAENDLPFSKLRDRVLIDLAAGRCVSITGLSNSGKSFLMRQLGDPATEKAFKKHQRKGAAFLYIDCNRAVESSGQAFYEIVIRSALERLEDAAPENLVAALRGHHQAVTEAASPFTASLSFNLALTDLCEQLDRGLILLIDEFDEIYTSLEERALLNLRALHDRFRDRLAFVTATLRALPKLRGLPVEGEFAELFARSTYAMPLLTEPEAAEFLEHMTALALDAEQRVRCFELSGGHPGLLVAIGQALASHTFNPHQLAAQVGQQPQPRAECLKLWTQVDQEERDALASLALDLEGGLPPHQRLRLEALGLLSAGRFFSPLFAEFVSRKARAPQIAVEGVHLDHDSGDVWVDGVRIPVLTDLEFRLLRLLHERTDKLTDKYTIVTSVWGESYLEDVDDARVEKLISRLRSKIEPDPGTPRYLITRRGRGYKLLSTPHASAD